MIVPLARARIPGRTARIVLATPNTFVSNSVRIFCSSSFFNGREIAKRCVVHEHIDTAMPFLGGGDRSLDLGWFGQIH
jgi:hypothetical protein